MQKNKKLMSKALCLGALCCLLTSNFAYADDEKLHKIFIDNHREARTQVEMRNFKQANALFNKSYKAIQKKEFPNTHDYVNHYGALMYYHCDKSEYSKVMAQYNKVQEIIKNSTEQHFWFKTDMNSPLIYYYNAIDDLDNMKKAIDNNMEIAKEVGDKGIEYFSLGEYVNYYFETKEFDKVKKCIKKKEKMNKKDTEGYVGNKAALAQDYINYYLNMGTPEKAIKIAQNNINFVNTEKETDINNLIEAYKIMSDSYNATGIKENKEQAIKYVTIAEKLNEEINPNNEYKKYEFISKKADFYNEMQEYDKAFNGYKKCVDIITKLIGNNAYELSEIYPKIANIYVQKGDIETALIYMCKAVSVASNVYGVNHVKTIALALQKANIHALNNQEKLKEIIENHYFEIIDSEKVVGQNKDVEIYYSEYFARKFFEAKEYDKSLKYAQKFLDTAWWDWQEDEANKLLSDIYKAQNKKFKSIKYKVKSKF